ncbi:MAG: DUF2007 domain-containing protein [Phycisphaerales bacterium]|nr:DUF2007 domain-containing protein [Phycisphaerales bacterium]
MTLLSTNTPFEADAIAAALQARGVNAQVILASNAAMWGGALGQAQLVVLASQEAAARRALEEIQAEVSQIDWDKVDLGSEPPNLRLSEATRTKRWMRTMMVVLVPVGLGLLALGVDRGDRTIQLLGGLLVFTSIAMAASIYLSPESDDQER